MKRTRKNKKIIKKSLPTQLMLKPIALSLLVASSISTAFADTDEYLQSAKNYLNDNKYGEAIIELRNALKEDKQNAEARILLADAYYHVNQYDKAETEYEKAVRLNVPKRRWAVNYAKTLISLGRGTAVFIKVPLEDTDPDDLQADISAVYGLIEGQRGDFKKAQYYFDKTLAIDADHADANLGVATLKLREQKFDETLAIIDKTLAKHPDNFQLQVMKAEVFATTGKIEEAISLLQNVAEKNPTQIRTQFLLFNYYIASNKFAEAEKLSEFLQGKIKGHFYLDMLDGKLLFAQRKFDEAFDKLQEASSKIGQPHPEVSRLLGMLHLQFKNWQSALDSLSTALALNPDDRIVALLLSDLYANQLKDTVRAREILDEMVRKNPNDASLLARLGSIYSLEGDFDKANEYLEKALAIDPDAGNYKTLLARTKLSLGDPESAIDLFKSVSSSSDNLDQADFWLILTYAKERKFDEAIALADQLIAKFTDNPLPLNAKGVIYLMQRDFANAEATFQKALAIDGKFKATRMNLARVAAGQEKFDDAVKILEQILTDFPQDTAAGIAIHLIYNTQKDFKAALEWINKVREWEPGNAYASQAAVQLLLKEQKIQDALTVANEFVAAAGSNPESHFLLGSIQLADKQQQYRKLPRGTERDYSNTIESYREAIRLSPKTPKFYLALARVEEMEGNRSAAISTYNDLLDFQPNNVDALVASGRLLLLDNKLNRALSRAEQLKSEQPLLMLGEQLEGDVYYQMNEMEKAQKAYQTAFDSIPSSSLARKISATQFRQGKKEDGFKTLTDWLAGHEDDRTTRFNLASRLQEHSRNKEAIAEYEYLIKDDPDNAVILNNLAWMLMVEGDSRSLDYARHLSTLNPTIPAVLDTIGWIFVQNNELAEGVSFLRKAIASNPKFSSAKYHLAYALNKQGNKGDAKAMLEEILAQEQPFNERNDAEKLLGTL